MTPGEPQELAATTEARSPRMRGRAGLVITIAVGVALAVGAFLLARSQATDTPELLSVGDQAPPFALAADDGAPVALAKSPGRPTLVAFVESGCSSCRAEAPLLAQLARSGARVLAVDVSHSSAEERAAFARDALEGVVPLAPDPEGTVGVAYRALVVPTIYVLRADGTIADAWAGRVDEERFESALAAART